MMRRPGRGVAGHGAGLIVIILTLGDAPAGLLRLDSGFEQVLVP